MAPVPTGVARCIARPRVFRSRAASASEPIPCQQYGACPADSPQRRRPAIEIGVEELLDIVADPSDTRVPEIVRACLAALGAQLRRLKEQILEFDRMIRAWHRSSEMSLRLDDCPGIGPVLATALVATVADPKAFRSGRNFSAWIGIVPKQHSSGGKNRLGSISKQGDRWQ